MAEIIFPYELPENWQWATLGNVCELSRGEKLSAKNLPYLNVKYLRGTNEKTFVESGNYVEEDSKLILVDGENSGEIFTVEENGYMGSTLRELKIFETVDADFFQYFVSTKKELYRQNKRGSAIPHLNKNLFYSTPIPLPPLDDQKRIVAVIESLFKKLDAAKSIVQKILDGYELRRAAILHKAFTGELTKKWRKYFSITLDDWQQKTLGEVCKKFVYGTSKKSKPVGKIIVIRMGNLQGGEIDWKNLAYSDDEEDIEKYKLSAGDVLFNRTNSAELVGKTSIYRGEYPAIYAGYLIKLDYEKNFLDGEYLNFILNSPEAKIYCDSVKSNAVNQSNINAKKISGFEIPLPPIDEQKEIVRVLDSLLEKEQRTKEIAEKILSEIDLLKRTILARAFRGALGTAHCS